VRKAEDDLFLKGSVENYIFVFAFSDGKNLPIVPMKFRHPFYQYALVTWQDLMGNTVLTTVGRMHHKVTAIIDFQNSNLNDLIDTEIVELF